MVQGIKRIPNDARYPNGTLWYNVSKSYQWYQGTRDPALYRKGIVMLLRRIAEREWAETVKSKSRKRFPVLYELIKQDQETVQIGSRERLLVLLGNG